MGPWSRPTGTPADSVGWGPVWLLATAMTAGAALAACGSSTAVATAPTQLKCQVTLAAPATPIGADGGAGAITVTTAPECPWDVSTSASWLSGLSPTSGQGTGTVEFRAAPNPSPAAREGEIVVNENRLRLSQQAATCRFDIRTASFSVAAGGETRDVAISAPGGCSWTVTTDAAWISFTTPVTGSGDGRVGVSIAPHPGAARRVGTIAVGDQGITVTQEPAALAPAPGCVYVVSSTSQGVVPGGGGDLSAAVTVAGGCAWTASSGVPWITVLAGASGIGNGGVAFRVAANTGSVRTGTVAVAGQTFTITQAAAPPAAAPPPPAPPPPPPPCVYAIAPADAAIGSLGGTGTVAVTAGAGCGWTANASANWITVTSGASGTGNGAVGFTLAPNLGNARTGAIAVAGRTFTVTQAAAIPCSYTITPTSISIDDRARDVTVAVTAGSGCAWTASSNASWIRITSGASGSGNGSVRFRVDRNRDDDRTGTLTIAGRTFTVRQDEEDD